MGRKKQKRVVLGEQQHATTSLGGLLGGLGFSASEASEDEAPPPPADASDPLNLAGCQGLKLRIEKKGRRGKSVAILAGVPEEKSAAVAKALRKTLGCGVSSKDGEIVVQGGQTDRIRAWLTEQGAPRVKGV